MRWIRHKMPWILGLLLLTGSLLGANRMMHNPRSDEGPRGRAASAQRNRANSASTDQGGINCQGLVVPELELTPLAPSQMGEVVEVFVRNEQKVKKDERLLRLGDEPARFKLREAESGLMVAKAMLSEAKAAVEKVKLERLGQKLKVDAKRREYDARKIELADAERMHQAGVGSDEKIQAARKMLEALDIAVQAEEIVLKIYDVSVPDYKVDQAAANVKLAETKRDEAQRMLDACVMKAPADGVIVRSYVGIGSKFGPQIQQPAFLFYSGGLTVRAEVDQEWASMVKEGQTARVVDYANSNQVWTGKVTFVANSFLPRRDAAMLPDVFQQNQERVLECRITLDPGQSMPRLNQKMRIYINPS